MKNIKIISFLILTGFIVENAINKENGMLNKFVLKQSLEFVQNLNSVKNTKTPVKTEIKTEYRYKVLAPKREYSRRVWVKARTLKECMNGGKVINNNTVECTNGYYKEIKVIE